MYVSFPGELWTMIELGQAVADPLFSCLEAAQRERSDSWAGSAQFMSLFPQRCKWGTRVRTFRQNSGCLFLKPLPKKSPARWGGFGSVLHLFFVWSYVQSHKAGYRKPVLLWSFLRLAGSKAAGLLKSPQTYAARVPNSLPTRITLVSASEGVKRGGYIVSDACTAAQGLLLATGSEVDLHWAGKSLLVTKVIWSRLTVLELPLLDL